MRQQSTENLNLALSTVKSHVLIGHLDSGNWNSATVQKSYILKRKDTEIRARSLQRNFGLASKISTVMSSPCIHCVHCVHVLREANRPCPSQEADQEFCSSFFESSLSEHCRFNGVRIDTPGLHSMPVLMSSWRLTSHALCKAFAKSLQTRIVNGFRTGKKILVAFSVRLFQTSNRYVR